MKNVLYLVAWSRVEVTNYHYENKYIENFTVKKGRYSNKKKKKKKSDIFHISAQNIDCGYSLEPPPRGSSNEYPQSIFY